MRLAVTGTHGLLGSSLVPALAGAGHDVVRLVRGEPSGPGEVAWDPAAGTIDAAGLAGIDGAVHLSGATIGRRWSAARKAEIVSSRLGSTRLLADTLAILDPRPVVLVCAGGVGIYGNRGDEILTEESSLGAGFLAELGASWEAAADPARDAGIRVVSFRQGIVLSRAGGALPRMLTPFRLGLGGRVGSGKQWWSWVSLDDTAAAYGFALEHDELAGPVNLTAPNPATNIQFVRALGRALHRPAKLPLPAFAVKTLFGAMGEAALLEGQRALPAKLLDAGFSFRHADLEGALTRALEV